MTEIFKDAFFDTVKMIPLLFTVYALIELVEYKYSEKLREKVEKAGNAGPAIGSIVGSVPQCGFSVISSALYNQKLITIGTLLAVYISTSDEAVPVILSQPGKMHLILPLIFTKIGLALFVGYLIDLIYKKSNKKIFNHIEKFENHECNHNHEIEESACCGHEIGDKPNAKDMILHPLVHTSKVFFFIFIASFLINYIFFKIGDDNISHLFLGNSIFQPIISAFIGLIPNCAASVAITEMYLKGAISYGSAISGLSAGAGLGLLVLFRENRNLKNTFTILGLLLISSISAGILIQYFYK